jgi:hypothetical protein
MSYRKESQHSRPTSWRIVKKTNWPAFVRLCHLRDLKPNQGLNWLVQFAVANEWLPFPGQDTAPIDLVPSKEKSVNKTKRKASR